MPSLPGTCLPLTSRQAGRPWPFSVCRGQSAHAPARTRTRSAQAGSQRSAPRSKRTPQPASPGPALGFRPRWVLSHPKSSPISTLPRPPALRQTASADSPPPHLGVFRGAALTPSQSKVAQAPPPPLQLVIEERLVAWPRLLPARGAHLHAQQSRTRGFHAPPPPHSPVALGGLLRTCPLHRGSRHLVAMVPAQGWAADKHRVRAGPRRSGYSAHCPWGRHRVLAGPPQAGGAGPTALGRGVGGTLPAQDPAGQGQAAPTPQASAPPKLMPSLPVTPLATPLSLCSSRKQALR